MTAVMECPECGGHDPCKKRLSVTRGESRSRRPGRAGMMSAMDVTGSLFVTEVMECPECGGPYTERQDAGGEQPDLMICHGPDCQWTWELDATGPAPGAETGHPRGTLIAG